MAMFFEGESHTFSEYLLVPGYSSAQNIPQNVTLRTPLVKFHRGEESAITLNIPMVSAIMQSVSGPRLAVALAQQGGISFIYGSQTPEDEAAMVREVKASKAGFVVSAVNLTPDMTLEQVMELKEQSGFSTMPVTDDGTSHGKLLGIVTSRDWRPSRDPLDKRVADFMTPMDKLVVAPDTSDLHDCNDIIWDHKLNALPIVDAEGHLVSIVFRKDYDSHKENPLELLDEHKRYMVGAGINTRDFAERVPLLVDAGADVLCIDSSEGYSEWQKITID
ncbi:MAG: IMP dehydrogenase, partial [Atopobiaceae bacterium]|nr:IMP dehydrogenase [Atopobiaceae bacterium]